MDRDSCSPNGGENYLQDNETASDSTSSNIRQRTPRSYRQKSSISDQNVSPNCDHQALSTCDLKVLHKGDSQVSTKSDLQLSFKPEQHEYSKAVKPTFSKAETFALSKAEKPVLSKEKKTVLSKEKKTVLSKAKKTALSKAEKPVLSKADEPALSKTEKTANAKVDTATLPKADSINDACPKYNELNYFDSNVKLSTEDHDLNLSGSTAIPYADNCQSPLQNTIQILSDGDNDLCSNDGMPVFTSQTVSLRIESNRHRNREPNILASRINLEKSIANSGTPTGVLLQDLEYEFGQINRNFDVLYRSFNILGVFELDHNLQNVFQNTILARTLLDAEITEEKEMRDDINRIKLNLEHFADNYRQLIQDSTNQNISGMLLREQAILLLEELSRIERVIKFKLKQIEELHESKSILNFYIVRIHFLGKASFTH